MKNDKNKTEEKNKITLEKLFELTEEKPLVLNESFESFILNKLDETVKHTFLKNFVVVKNINAESVIVQFDFIRKHLIRLLEIIFSKTDKISAADLHKQFEHSFLAIHNIVITGKVFSSFCPNDPFDIPDIYDFYYDSDTSVDDIFCYIKNELSGLLFKLGIKVKNKEFIKDKKLPFIYGAIKTFVESNVSKMSFEDFIFAFPKENFDLIMPMSDKEKVLSELKKYPDYFIVKNDEILITDFLDKTLNEIEKSKFPYGENQLANTNSGVVAITLENGFSLFGEASEYVKLRNIIDVFATENFNEEIKKYFEPSELTANNLTSLLSEPLKLRNNRESLEKVKNWMRENLKIAFIEKDYENAKVLEFAIGIDRAPLLKTEDVYENIFATMIKEKKSKFEKVLVVKDEKN